MTELQRCGATTKTGRPCRARALEGSPFCLLHGPDADPAELGRHGGLVSGARRSVRERFREDAELHYETLINSLLGAVQAEVTRWGDCPNCRHRVPVTFPDIRARTDAVRTLVEQGYGKPPVREDHRVLHVNAQLEDLQAQMRSLSDEELLALASEDDAPPEAA